MVSANGEGAKLFIDFRLGRIPQRDKAFHGFYDQILISNTVYPNSSEVLLVDKPSTFQQVQMVHHRVVVQSAQSDDLRYIEFSILQ